MKKVLGLLLFALLVCGVLSAVESPLFAKVVPIHKVYSHEKGYKVLYLNAHGDVKESYIPMEWFYQTSEFRTETGARRAELVRKPGPDSPYMEIFWRNGTFDHLRLVVNSDYNAKSWGIVRPGEHLETMFDPSKAVSFLF